MSKQCDEDSWELAPTLVERINAAIALREYDERDFYKQMTEAYTSVQLDDKEFTVSVLFELHKMDIEFTLTLERHLETGDFIPAVVKVLEGASFASPLDESFIEDHRNPVVSLAAWYSVWGLMSTAACRREIRAGRTAAATWEMNTATELCALISACKADTFDNMVRGPVFEVGRDELARKARGRRKRCENDHDRHKTWVGEWRRLHRKKWPDPKIWKYIASQDKKTAGHVRRTVKAELARQHREASRAEADS
jgi:hypothetical protein